MNKPDFILMMFYERKNNEMFTDFCKIYDIYKMYDKSTYVF